VTSWKETLQICDLETEQRLEIACRKCGYVYYLTVVDLTAMGARKDLYLDEVESRLHCKARGCRGKVRLAMTHKGETSGFVGGLA
jgi:hypothetical protein